MKKSIAAIFLLLILVIVIFLLPKKGHKSSMNQTMPSFKDTSNSVIVNAIEVKRMTTNLSIDITGSLSAWKEIDIVSEAQGKIEWLNFESGQTKQKGAVLAKIDNTLKLLAVENAKVSTDKLKNDYERINNLFKGGTASQQELDNALYSYKNAEIQLDQAQKQLTDATITAPFSGIITKKNVEIGAYVNIGSPIATIVDISKFKVKLNVSETNVYHLKIGDNAIITTDVYPGVSFKGKVSFISSKGDDTHNYPVEIAIDNNNQHSLKAGTFVSVHFEISDSKSRLYIPRQALQGSTSQASVYVVKNGKALLKNIVIGIESGEYLEVISGISEGEKVVTVGQINLSDGKSVTISNN